VKVDDKSENIEIPEVLGSIPGEHKSNRKSRYFNIKDLEFGDLIFESWNCYPKYTQVVDWNTIHQ